MKKVTKHSAFSKSKKEDAGKTEKRFPNKTKDNDLGNKGNEDARNGKSFQQTPQSEDEQPMKQNHVQIEPLPPESNIN